MTASLHKLQLCLKSAKCFISAGQLPGQLSPSNPRVTGPLRDEGWLGQEGGGSYVTTSGTASQRFPEEFWEHQGPTCVCEKEGDGGMDGEGGDICQQFKRRDQSHILRVQYAEICWGHDANTLSWLKLPSPPASPPSPLTRDKPTTVYPS